MSTKLTDHIANHAHDILEINVTDEAGAGGAHHRYEITGFEVAKNASFRTSDGYVPPSLIVLFQNGPIKEAGVNGITQEILLAIVAHRLRCFQAGPYACESNATALSHVEAALEALKARTRERTARGVEGTHKH